MVSPMVTAKVKFENSSLLHIFSDISAQWLGRKLKCRKSDNFEKTLKVTNK